MRLILPALSLFLFAGCGTETRTSWENCRQHRHMVGIPVPADPAHPGTVRVVYPDRKPIQSMSGLGHPESHQVRFEEGVHVNSYDANGVLVHHRWQAAVPLK